MSVVKAESRDLQSELDRVSGEVSDAKGRRDALATSLASTEAEVERTKQRLTVVRGPHVHRARQCNARGG